MVYVGECHFCGKPNLNPPNSDFTFSKHYGGFFVSCADRECKNKHTDTSCEHELAMNRFSSYSINRPVKDTNIRRSNGDINTAEIKKYQDIDAEIRIIHNNIEFYLEFEDGGEMKCKFDMFSNLSKINIHLPLITIHYPSRCSEKVKGKLRDRQKMIDDYCISKNVATRLMLISFTKNDGLFGMLPREILSLIIGNYYGII